MDGDTSEAVPPHWHLLKDVAAVGGAQALTTYAQRKDGLDAEGRGPVTVCQIGTRGKSQSV